jgi:hypothetical protein
MRCAVRAASDGPQLDDWIRPAHKMEILQIVIGCTVQRVWAVPLHVGYIPRCGEVDLERLPGHVERLHLRQVKEVKHALSGANHC